MWEIEVCDCVCVMFSQAENEVLHIQQKKGTVGPALIVGEYCRISFSSSFCNLCETAMSEKAPKLDEPSSWDEERSSSSSREYFTRVRFSSP